MLGNRNPIASGFYLGLGNKVQNTLPTTMVNFWLPRVSSIPIRYGNKWAHLVLSL